MIRGARPGRVRGAAGSSEHGPEYGIDRVGTHLVGDLRRALLAFGVGQPELHGELPLGAGWLARAGDLVLLERLALLPARVRDEDGGARLLHRLDRLALLPGGEGPVERLPRLRLVRGRRGGRLPAAGRSNQPGG